MRVWIKEVTVSVYGERTSGFPPLLKILNLSTDSGNNIYAFIPIGTTKIPTVLFPFFLMSYYCILSLYCSHFWNQPSYSTSTSCDKDQQLGKKIWWWLHLIVYEIDILSKETRSSLPFVSRSFGSLVKPKNPFSKSYLKKFIIEGNAKFQIEVTEKKNVIFFPI